MDKETQLVNIRLKRKLWQKVKIKSAIDGKTITQWLTDLLERELVK
jgi:hypothetical protein